MKIYKILIIISVLLSMLISACGNLEKDVVIKLPDYERKLSVECYITPEGIAPPGVPQEFVDNLPPQFRSVYMLMLTETIGYYDEFDLPFIDDAEVLITYRGHTDTLSYQLIQTSDSQEVGVYLGFRTMGDVIGEPFQLAVTEPVRTDGSGGRKLSAETQLLAKISIDSIGTAVNDKGEILARSNFQEPGATEDYYYWTFERRRLHVTSNGNQRDTVRTAEIIYYFNFDDVPRNGEVFSLATNYILQPKDTIVSTLYHINKDYYDFLETIDGATVASFSPFAQPTRILNTVEGGFGVFTAINLDQIIMEIK